MRYRPEHKIEVHRRIVKDASRRVRTEGLNGAVVGTVMRDAGLTHGGFYKHFRRKEDLLVESLREAFREIEETLIRVAEKAPAWRSVEGDCENLPEPGTLRIPRARMPPGALAPELARADKGMKPQIVAELVNYKSQMMPFMPGRRIVDKERAFFAIFSTMVGSVEIARMLPDPAMREKVLASARDLLLRSF